MDDYRHQYARAVEPSDESENVRTYRPGETTPDGGKYEPAKEPDDLGEFIKNQFKDNYGEDDDIHGGTGYILSDGRGVSMGPMSTRHEDHRTAIPTYEAMQRWGWPADIVKEYAEGTRGRAMVELMRRAKAIRTHLSRDVMTLHSAHFPLTSRQRQALITRAFESPPTEFTFDVEGYEPIELSHPDPNEIVEALEQGPRKRQR